MNKDQVISKLMRNPKYDSAWIDKASDLIVNNNFIETYLAQFSADQLSIISQVMATYGPEGKTPDDQFVELITDSEFNVSQMQILVTARNAGVETSKLSKICNHSIPYGIMNYLAQAMIDGLDLAETTNVMAFNIDQIYEIVAGFHSGIDFRIYANPAIPAECMGVMRTALEAGYYAKYDINTKQIVLDLPKEDDLMDIIAGFDSQIKDDQSKGLDTSGIESSRAEAVSRLAKVRTINGTEEDEN